MIRILVSLILSLGISFAFFYVFTHIFCIIFDNLFNYNLVDKFWSVFLTLIVIYIMTNSKFRLGVNNDR